MFHFYIGFVCLLILNVMTLGLHKQILKAFSSALRARTGVFCILAVRFSVENADQHMDNWLGGYKHIFNVLETSCKA